MTPPDARADAVATDNVVSLRPGRRFIPAWTVTGETELAALTTMIMDAADVAVFRARPSGDIIEANPAFQRLNASLGGCETMVAVPGVRAGVQRCALLAQTVTRPQALEIDGETRHYWLRFVPIIDADGTVVGVGGACQDWTAQLGRLNSAMLDQARFRDFARASSDWFWETDAAWRLTAVSDRLTGVLGQPTFGLIGKPVLSLGRLEANIAGERPIDRAMLEHAPFRDQLFVLETDVGEAALFHLSGVPMFDDKGRFIGYRGAGMDVTRVYLMEEEARSTRRSLETAMGELSRKNVALDAASAQAQAALQAKNEFLAAMSHELRTPLNAIIGFAEAMQMQVFGNLTPHYVAYANDIVTAGHHLLGLINDVLDVSVIETGEIALTIETVSLANLLDQARSLLVLRAEAKRLDMSTVRCAEDIRVLADERRALQIFVNLLTNAVKFTPEGGRIGVDVGRKGDLVTCTVWDTGTGIAPANHERVFEKFQQCVNDAYHGKPEGTGLGLHISRQLARLMHGDISLESELGQGARFTVALPVAPV